MKFRKYLLTGLALLLTTSAQAAEPAYLGVYEPQKSPQVRLPFVNNGGGWEAMPIDPSLNESLDQLIGQYPPIITLKFTKTSANSLAAKLPEKWEFYKM